MCFITWQEPEQLLAPERQQALQEPEPEQLLVPEQQEPEQLLAPERQQALQQEPELLLLFWRSQQQPAQAGQRSTVIVSFVMSLTLGINRPIGFDQDEIPSKSRKNFSIAFLL
jgi:hypothetical protein